MECPMALRRSRTSLRSFFQGWRITATSGVVGSRAYALIVGGKVCALDYPRWKVEVLRAKRNSDEARGNVSDSMDFRFIDATNRIDVRCSRLSVPPTWLVASRILGLALLEAIRQIRAAGGRVEGPQQVVHFSLSSLGSTSHGSRDRLQQVLLLLQISWSWELCRWLILRPFIGQSARSSE